MTDVQLRPARDLGFDARGQMAGLFVEGFYQWLHYFSKDKERLKAAFTSAINLDAFFVAVAGGDQVVSMVACPVGAPSLRLDKGDFVERLGAMRGRIAHRVLKKHLVDNVYPFPVTPEMGSIEFVAADPAFQGRGITGRLIEYAMRRRPYSTYVLEVAESNTRAVRLYERLGFTEFQRKAASKRSGIGAYLYLRTQSDSR